MMKRCLLILFSIPLVCAIERFCHAQTDGFAIVNIASSSRPNLRWEVENPCKWDNILQQKFTYLSCGAQAYVFESADGRYVLKFFKQQHMRIPPIFQKIPLPKKWNSYRKKKIIKKRALLDSTFESMRIAFTKLREETALVALHLNKTTTLTPKLTIVDKIGVAHTIDPNQYEFVLQKKAKLAYEEIERWMATGREEKAQALITQAVMLSKKRIDLHVFDKDPDFSTNFGVVEGKLVQIDIGRFSEKIEKDPEELYRITRALKDHLSNHYLSLALKFDEIYEDIATQTE